MPVLPGSSLLAGWLQGDAAHGHHLRPSSLSHGEAGPVPGAPPCPEFLPTGSPAHLPPQVLTPVFVRLPLRGPQSCAQLSAPQPPPPDLAATVPHGCCHTGSGLSRGSQRDGWSELPGPSRQEAPSLVRFNGRKTSLDLKILTGSEATVRTVLVCGLRIQQVSGGTGVAGPGSPVGHGFAAEPPPSAHLTPSAGCGGGSVSHRPQRGRRVDVLTVCTEWTWGTVPAEGDLPKAPAPLPCLGSPALASAR